MEGERRDPQDHGGHLVTHRYVDTSLVNNGNQGDTITLAVTPNDGTENGTDATANAVIGLPNQAPVANGQDQITARNIAKAITLTGSDANFDPITFTIVDNPAHSTLSGTGANRTYTPVASYQGPDSFTFRVNDGVFNSNLATVNIQVAKPFVTTVSDSGFAKAGIGAQLGSIVTWTNIGSNAHNVTDSSGMGLFSSGNIAPNGTFSFMFFAAGNYNYTSTGNGFTAKVKVPVLCSARFGRHQHGVPDHVGRTSTAQQLRVRRADQARWSELGQLELGRYEHARKLHG